MQLLPLVQPIANTEAEEEARAAAQRRDDTQRQAKRRLDTFFGGLLPEIPTPYLDDKNNWRVDFEDCSLLVLWDYYNHSLTNVHPLVNGVICDEVYRPSSLAEHITNPVPASEHRNIRQEYLPEGEQPQKPQNRWWERGGYYEVAIGRLDDLIENNVPHTVIPGAVSVVDSAAYYLVLITKPVEAKSEA